MRYLILSYRMGSPYSSNRICFNPVHQKKKKISKKKNLDMLIIVVQKEMIAVYPIRYKDNTLEFLMIKRATVSYNWQCVSGSVGDTMDAFDHPKGENPLECANRELFEETGYTPAIILPLDIPRVFYSESEEGEGDSTPPHLQEFIKEIQFHNFIARIDQRLDPVLNPAEHTDWKWCSFEIAYKIIKWRLEKELLRYVYNYLIEIPLK
jgi:8-oxo-dGTP pyrophosphatase MutT (NUDIX family)